MGLIVIARVTVIIRFSYRIMASSVSFYSNNIYWYRVLYCLHVFPFNPCSNPEVGITIPTLQMSKPVFLLRLLAENHIHISGKATGNSKPKGTLLNSSQAAAKESRAENFNLEGLDHSLEPKGVPYQG